eukprot:11647199-Ditylum_brightwellii.AAC.1
MTTTINDTKYANASKLVNHATNCKNLPPSHKASLPSSSIRADFSSLPLKPGHISHPCWTYLDD